jgi:hypothetical protein
VSQARLKSSFIYLANAGNDLRGNWATFAAVLAPLIILGALCLLPDALNLQHQLAEKFSPGGRTVAWIPAQTPYAPLAADVKPLFPAWIVLLFHVMLVMLTFSVNLVVLCTIRRIQAGARLERILSEALEIYREAAALAPAFYWIVFLQLVAPIAALALWWLDNMVSVPWLAVAVAIYLIEVAALFFAAIVYLWLYFARYALVLDGMHSFHGLLFSRDMMRKRFFRVATRIVVFLAVWSGYNSWAAAAFVVVSLILGPVGVFTGYLWGVIFVLDLAAISVTFVTAAFFVAAGVRLYQDLILAAEEPATTAADPSMLPPPPLPTAL